jgi:farnesyl diphosphate synthase
MHDFTVFLARLGEVEKAVENLLDRLLSPTLLEEEVARPSRLLDAMRYATLSGSKRLRPFLVVETANALGTTGIEPLRVGAAIELVHCYSLIHDDLPALDSDDLRRGRPTVHKAFDEATAILAGDALLTYAFDVLSCRETHNDPEIRSTLCRGLARAAGIGGLAGGQMLDLEAEGPSAFLRELD